jgi:prolyl oligopeptidase
MQYTLSGFEVVGDKILSFYLKDANEKLKLHNLDGGLIKEIKLPTLGSIVSFSKEWDETGFFIRFTSFFVAPTDFRYDLLEDKLEEIQSPQISIATDQFELKQVWYPSKDGTNVPMFIMHQKNIKLNGDNPTILYGYGGFGISLTPSFRDSSIPFLEKGGVYVIANLRGGGEFGEKWHSAGKKEKKQNVFDDFISAAEWLINNRYTNSRRLAIYGSSNGGLLTAATVVQRPDLFKAVIIGAPITDMIRYPIFSMGRYWIQEYGDPDKKEDFEYLIKYSPYHNVRENADYPSILLTTSDTDQRVDPMHARKMAARLQYLNKSNNPIILRTYKSMGHGPGATVSKRIDNLVDHLAFIFSQLGIN